MMTRPWFVSLFLFVVIAAAGCGASVGALRTRAAFDFSCAESALSLTELNSGDIRNGSGAVYGVTGCGRRGTYVQGDHDAWILNTDEQPSQAQ